MDATLERIVKEAGFKVFGEKIVAADENSSGLATESVKRLVEIVGRECMLPIFDGYTVYCALDNAAAKRTSYENVSDTLDALARVMRDEQET